MDTVALEPYVVFDQSTHREFARIVFNIYILISALQMYLAAIKLKQCTFKMNRVEPGVPS